MGTWGPGNLDNDYVQEELGDRADALLEQLIARMRRPTSREWDEYDYTTLFGELEVVFALETKGLMPAARWPDPKEFDELKRDYLRDWDKHVNEAHNAEYADAFAARRRVITRTLGRFHRLCRQHAEE